MAALSERVSSLTVEGEGAPAHSSAASDSKIRGQRQVLTT